MSIRESKIIDLEKKVERLQSRLAFLEKYIQADDNGIILTVGGSSLSISESNVAIRSNGTMNILSHESTTITSGNTMDIQSSDDMNIRGSVIHIN